MKKLLIGLLAFGSTGAFASDVEFKACSLKAEASAMGLHKVNVAPDSRKSYVFEEYSDVSTENTRGYEISYEISLDSGNSHQITTRYKVNASYLNLKNDSTSIADIDCRINSVERKSDY